MRHSSVDLFFLREQAHLLGGGVGEFRQVEAHALGLRFAGIEARKREEPLDDAHQPLDFLEQAGERVPQFGFRSLRREQHRLEFAADDRQRRAQFVRGIGGEAAGVLKRLVQPRDHLIEHRDEMRDFVVALRHGQALESGSG